MKPLQEERLLSTALLLLATVELDSVINALFNQAARVKGLDQKLGSLAGVGNSKL